MDLKSLQKHWDQFGRENPLWAVLTSTKHWDVGEFFATGVEEIDDLMAYAAALRVPFAKRKALDFGCGVGRLTQALARHFDEVCGVDISPSMIEAAQRYNRYGARCRYYLNAADHLGLFPDGEFDFIYTNIVLQHMAPRYAKNYIAEFIRVLRPGGLLIFQLPSAMVEPNPLKKFLVSWAPESLWRFYRAVKHRVLDWFRRQPRMEMYGIVTDEVARFIQQQNARLVEFKLDQRPTANRAWICYLYSVTKPA